MLLRIYKIFKIFNPFYKIRLIIKSFQRSVLRGHIYLKNKNKLKLIISIKQEFAKSNLKFKRTNKSVFFFNNSLDISDLIIKQYLIKRVTNRFHHSLILAAIGYSKYPFHILPSIFLSILEQNKIPIARKLSFISWYAYMFILWGYGNITLLKYIIKMVPYKKLPFNGNNSSLFINLMPENFPD